MGILKQAIWASFCLSAGLIVGGVSAMAAGWVLIKIMELIF